MAVAFPRVGPHAPRLRPGDVHVWYLPIEPVDERALHRHQWLLLSEVERMRIGRVRVPGTRTTRFAARALLRTVLSQYAPVPPAAWVFEETRHGRPEILAPALSPRLRFNVSHTAGLVACAVALEVDVGLDVEDIRRQLDENALAQRFFAAEEVRALAACSEPARRRCAFFEYWTLKEAYTKARGLGLTLPLDRIAFGRDPAGAVRVTFHPPLDDDPDRWQFALYWTTRWHPLALAVRRTATDSCTINVRRACLRGVPSPSVRARTW